MKAHGVPPSLRLPVLRLGNYRNSAYMQVEVGAEPKDALILS